MYMWKVFKSFSVQGYRDIFMLDSLLAFFSVSDIQFVKSIEVNSNVGRRPLHHRRGTSVAEAFL